MFDCDEIFTSETDESLPASPIYDRYQSGDGYHVVPLPYTGTFMPPKPDLVFHNAPNIHETGHTAFNIELSLTKSDKDLSHTYRPSAPIIKDWVSDSEDDSEAEIPQNAPNQTVSGKDSSNPLMADNLPKLVWYSTLHVALMKSWLVQKQTALGQTTTGKENSNPFIAGSLPKAMLFTFILGICINMKVNDVMRLQALVNKKKVIINEATIRDALRLDDAESIDCLPNEEIFTELLRMGYEKPSTKITFYKAFFSPQWNLVRNVDSSTKFYMYLQFLQLMIRVQVGDLSLHSTRYSSPALTQKVFANMRRVGKGFFEVDTPLFEGMIVAQQDDDVVDEGAASVAVDDVPAAVDEPSIPSPTPTTQPPPPS
nr:hypothetical protein [Tanacetum cinerariifolium]